MIQQEIQEINEQTIVEALDMIATNPIGAAERLDKIGDYIKNLATQIREQAAQEHNPWQVSGSMGDRVRIQVLGPDGHVKREADTDVQRGL